MNDSLLSRFEATEAKVSKKRYVVELSADERKRLEELIRKGKSPAKKQLKARILLRADESRRGPNGNDPKISEALGTYPMMCARVRQQFAQGGIDAVLNRKQRATPPVPRIFDGEKEARLIALACSQPPEGRTKWTLRLLESKVIELNIVDHASDNTIGRVLKKCAQASSRAAMGHPAASKQRVRSGDGGCSGRLQATTRQRLSAGLSGRGVKTTACRHTGADPDEAGATGAPRLRV
jgi:hypothetical protein